MSLETRVGSGSIDIAQEYKVLLKHALKMAIATAFIMEVIMLQE